MKVGPGTIPGPDFGSVIGLSCAEPSSAFAADYLPYFSPFSTFQVVSALPRLDSSM